MNKPIVAAALWSIIGLITPLTTPAFAEDDQHREHGAHQHGMAQLNISQEGKILLLELETPAINITGFEHLPQNREQQTVVAQATAKLGKGEDLFHLTSAAACTLIESKVNSALITPVAEKDLAEHHDEQKEATETHHDFDVNYRFNCEHPEQLHQIEVMLFEHFPLTSEIEVQLIFAGGQQHARLTASHSQLKF
ncbi:MAG: DUF2796 domain-containing protein [Gammaproteobacteria bacterium]|nr:DUF2796 domain-containing protein [Gammaproteobacteria bacterium]